MNIVPVRDRQRLGEFSALVNELVLVPHQEHGRDQLHFQFGDLHPGARVPASAPTKVRVDDVRDWVRAQPSTGVVLVRVGVEFRVQVDFADGIREEIAPPDQFSVDGDILADVPSKGGTSERKSLRLARAGLDNRQFILPGRDGDGAEFVVCGDE